MAHFSGNIFSHTLQMETSLEVLLPFDYPNYADDAQACRVLYLLHGHSDCASAWQRWTAVERYAKQAGIAVIMPEVQRSFYTDMSLGLAYFSYITQELPQLCNRMFGISHCRQDTVIAGNSMGGYGALRAALAHPELYSGCAAFSGCFDMKSVEQRLPQLQPELQAIFGLSLEKIQEQSLSAAAVAVANEQRPWIWMSCGLQDSTFLPQSRQLADELQGLGYRISYRESDGKHDWKYWDTVLEQFITERLIH